MYLGTGCLALALAGMLALVCTLVQDLWHPGNHFQGELHSMIGLLVLV